MSPTEAPTIVSAHASIGIDESQARPAQTTKVGSKKGMAQATALAAWGKFATSAHRTQTTVTPTNNRRKENVRDMSLNLTHTEARRHRAALACRPLRLCASV